MDPHAITTGTAATAEVVPVSLTDQLKPVPNIRTRTFFIIDDCLDEEALRKSLDRLIRNHWRKLGGRLVSRRDKSHLLEYHVPMVFGENDVLFDWTSKEHGCSIDNVAAPIRSPEQDKGPLLLPPMTTIDSWFRPSSWPYHRSDETSDAPLLYIHLSMFNDATVLCVSLPHTVADQMGLANIIKAWLGLMEGRTPPPMVENEAKLSADSCTETKFHHGELLRKGRQRIRRPGEYFLVVLPLIPDLVINAKEESCIIFFPLQLIRALRERYSRTLCAKYGDVTRISDSDVITAILLKFSRMNKKTPRTVALSQTINLRSRIPELVGAAGSGFIHNCLHYATARIRLAPTTPIGEIAYANRRAIEEAIELRDIELGRAIVREMVRRGQANHTCEPFERSYHVSNWCAAWRDLDFSPAIKGPNKARARPKLLVLGQSGERGKPLRFSALILSKGEDGYWAQFGTSLAAMNLVRQHLVNDPNLNYL